MLMASDNSLLQWLPTDPKADLVALDQTATLAGLNLSYTHEPLKEPSPEVPSEWVWATKSLQSSILDSNVYQALRTTALQLFCAKLS